MRLFCNPTDSPGRQPVSVLSDELSMINEFVSVVSVCTVNIATVKKDHVAVVSKHRGVRREGHLSETLYAGMNHVPGWGSGREIFGWSQGGKLHSDFDLALVAEDALVVPGVEVIQCCALSHLDHASSFNSEDLILSAS